jgi:peptide/nickel transport system permease protein
MAAGTSAAVGRSASRPSSYRDAVTRVGRAILRNRKATIGLVLLLFITFVAMFPGQLAPYDPQAAIFDMQAAPSSAHLLGTTQVGEDVFSQLIWGTRLTLVITVSVGLIVTFISVLVGVTAAYVGGTVDSGLSLLTDIFLIIPTLPLLIVLSTYLEGSGTIAIIAVLCVTGWAFGARQLRAQGLAIRTKDFLEAARARGERRPYIVLVEILPNMLSLVVASFLGSAVYTVATAAGLQFLGLGNSGEITWGTMLHFAQQNGALESGNPFWALAPGAAVALLGTAFALLNYAFDEIASPALRATRRRRAAP